jgi:preprotein translocase subunit SecE
MAKTALVAGDQPNNPKPNALVEWFSTTYEQSRTFLSDVRGEMRKVVTPSRKEVQATTTVVLVTVFVFALFFWIVDSIFELGLHKLLTWLVGPQ